MTVIEALFLGLIQGITEFLPISSSAHLIIFRHFMKIEDTQTVFFNVLLHFGSMIAILLTFSKEWKRLFLALCGIIIDLFHNLKEHFSSQHQERKQYRKVLGSNYRMLAFLLILTTIPTAVIGGMIQSLVTLTSSNLLAPGVGLEINELPVLTTRSKDILQPGMTFAFEPKFVLAGIGAVGIENTFLVTDSGVEKMTLLDENIIEL